MLQLYIGTEILLCYIDSDLKSTIHGEVDLIRYATEFSAEISESYEYLYVMYITSMKA